ncbi:hypothetical protein [Deinococcus sp. PEB2-63]
MPWTLEIWNPTRTQRLKTLSSDTVTELDGGFRWQLDQYGDCRQWEATGRNDRLGIPPRAVIRFVVDGTPWFHGVIVDPPSVTSPDAEALTALGGREILAAALMDGTAYRNRGVYQIARDILSRLCPPALTYDATQIGDGSGTDTGPGLDTFYSPTATLADVMDALAKAAGVPWGVDVLGRPFLGRPASAPLVVPYEGQPWRRLTVQGREACTQAVLRVVSAPSGLENVPLWNVVGGVVTPYLPRTVTVAATHADHGTYQARQAHDVPDGVSVLANATPNIPAGDGTQNLTNPSAAIDGNPSTYASGSGSTWRAQYSLTDASTTIVLGFRITYGLALGDARVELRVRSESALDGVNRNTVVATTTLDGADVPVSRTIILPQDARHGAWQAFDVQLRTYGASTINIHEVAFIVLDTQAAQRVAEGYLQTPYASPAEIALDRLVPPTATVTVTGSPDGNVTGPAAQFEYTHLPLQPRRTVVKLGATGQSAAARELRFGGAR